MKLQTAPTDGLNVITAYDAGFVAVNGVRHAHSVLVRAKGDVMPWAVRDIDDLDDFDLASMLSGAPTVVLIGTGVRQRFPGVAARRRLAAAGVAVEFMDSGAAARTFNILVSEGRDALCALLVDA